MRDLSSKIRIELLGRFQVTQSPAEPVRLRSRTARALLAYLALNAGQDIPRGRIAGLLWENEPEAVARHNLRQTLSELRTAVGPSIVIRADKETLQLSAANISVDVIDFVANCNSPSLETLEAAVAAYTGDMTTDFEIRSSAFDDWRTEQSRVLHAQALNAFDHCIRMLSEAGRQKDALQICERLLVLDPLRERTHQLLIALENHVNGRGSALARAKILAMQLREQLGVRPEQATKELVASLTASSDTEHLPPPTMQAGFPNRANRPWTSTRVGAALLGIMSILALSALASDRLGITGHLKAKFSNDKAAFTEIRHSIAVLPFTQQVDMQKLASFTQRLERNLTDNLSYVASFLVISNDTMRTYRNSKLDPRTIGKELNVSYLLTGHAQLENEKIVVLVRLIDTRTGGQQILTRIEQDVDSRSDASEEITTALSRQLQVEITISEGLRNERAELANPEYGGLIARGWAETFNAARGGHSEQVAMEYFEKALALNPKSVTARIGIGRILITSMLRGRGPTWEKDMQRADEMLTRAVELSRTTGPAVFFLASLRKMQGRMQETEDLLNRLLSFQPSNADAHAQIAHLAMFLGRPHESEVHIQKAIRLSPADDGIGYWYWHIGQAELHTGRYDKAVEWLEMAVARNPRIGVIRVYMTAAYELNRQPAKAAASAIALKQVLPNFAVANMRTYNGGYTHPTYTPGHERIIAAVERALNLAQATQ